MNGPDMLQHFHAAFMLAAQRVIDDGRGHPPDDKLAAEVCEKSGLWPETAPYVDKMARSILELVAAMQGKAPVFTADSDGGAA